MGIRVGGGGEGATGPKSAAPENPSLQPLRPAPTTMDAGTPWNPVTVRMERKSPRAPGKKTNEGRKPQLEVVSEWEHEYLNE